MRLSISHPIYRVFRFSSIYLFYLRLFRKPAYSSYQDEILFYKELRIPKNSLVFDIGANIGDKSALFSNFCQKIIAVEPDKFNYNILQKRFRYNSKIEIVNSAVSNKIGKEMFYVNSKGSPANTLSEKWKKNLEDPAANRWSKMLKFEMTYEVDVVALDDLIKKYGTPYYIKIDVEGYELEVIKGLKTPIPVLSFEANFPEFRMETLNCIEEIRTVSNNTVYNCINSEHNYFWPQHKNYSFITNWLKETDLKYFEVFCFNPE